MKAQTIFVFILTLIFISGCKSYQHLQKNFDGYVISSARADSMQKYLWNLLSDKRAIYDTNALVTEIYKPSDLKKLFRYSVDKKRNYSIYFLPAAIRAEDTSLYKTLTGYSGDMLINRITTIVAVNVKDKSSGKGFAPPVFLLVNRLCPPPDRGCLTR